MAISGIQTHNFSGDRNLVVMGTNFTGSCTSNYHMIKTTTTPLFQSKMYRIPNVHHIF